MNRKERRGQKSKIRRSGAAHPAYAEACRRYEAGRLDEAQHFLKQVLDDDPRHADGLHLLGAIAQRTGRPAAAAELIRRAIAIRGDDAAYHHNLGLALLGAGDAKGAEQAFARAAALDPEDAESRVRLASLLLERGKNAEAEENARAALALDPRAAAAHCILAGALHALGQADAAVQSYEAALALDPAFPLALNNLGRVLYGRKDFSGAEKHLRRYLEADPADRYGARLLLAAMGAGAAPDRASEAHMRHLYAQRAASWDAKPAYYAHTLVAEALARFLDGGKKMDILDAGCGTGLAGPLLRARASRLDGVDLSAEMLAAARAKNIYDALHCGDLTAFMKDAKGRYDAIVSAATLIHFGDLAPVLAAAAGALKADGLMAFTLFPAEDDHAVGPADFEGLAQGGCFAHGRGHIRKAAEAAGFEVKMLADETHEHDGEKAIPGLVVVLQKR